MSAQAPKDNAVAAALREAAAGLLYMSETDEPFEAVHWKNPGRPLDAARLLELTHAKPKTPVREESLESFFKDLTTPQDWHGEAEREDVRRYQKLKETIQSRLSGAKVFRVGEINVEIYIVGLTPEGDWAGLRTRAVET